VRGWKMGVVVLGVDVDVDVDILVWWWCGVLELGVFGTSALLC
jgi:hypothetical protein